MSINEKVDLAEIENSKSQKLLGLPIDSELSFEKHINDICDKSKAELNALSPVAPFISFNQKKMLMNVIFKARSKYCPLVWKQHNCKLNNKKSQLHELDCL